MKIVHPKIETYIENLIVGREKIFKEIERFAEKEDFPIVGPRVGQLLYQYTLLMKPTRILELGSGYGYSALWFAKGANKDCEIVCIDFEKKNEELAKNFFAKAGYAKDRFRFLIGDALEILENLEGEFDIIFNDIDKEEYPEAFKKSLTKLRKGGILITDNTLWYGFVTKKRKADEATEGVRKYNEFAFTNQEVISVLLPLRDGITISIKI